MFSWSHPRSLLAVAAAVTLTACAGDTQQRLIDTAPASPETGPVVIDLGKIASAHGVPNAVFKTVPAAVSGAVYGNNPLTVQFNNCQSRPAAEDDDLKFTYDFDGDGSVDAFGHCRWEHTFSDPAAARVCVSDRRGNDVCQTWDIRPGSLTPPPFAGNRPSAGSAFGFITCGGASSVSLTLSDPDGDPVSWTTTIDNGTMLTPSAGGPVPSGSVVNFQFQIVAGAATVWRVSVVDNIGNWSVPVQFLPPTAICGGTIEIWF